MGAYYRSRLIFVNSCPIFLWIRLVNPNVTWRKGSIMNRIQTVLDTLWIMLWQVYPRYPLAIVKKEWDTNKFCRRTDTRLPENFATGFPALQAIQPLISSDKILLYKLECGLARVYMTATSISLGIMRNLITSPQALSDHWRYVVSLVFRKHLFLKTNQTRAGNFNCTSTYPQAWVTQPPTRLSIFTSIQPEKRMVSWIRLLCYSVEKKIKITLGGIRTRVKPSTNSVRLHSIALDNWATSRSHFFDEDFKSVVIFGKWIGEISPRSWETSDRLNFHRC